MRWVCCPAPGATRRHGPVGAVFGYRRLHHDIVRPAGTTDRGRRPAVVGERLALGRGYLLHFRELQQALPPDLDAAVRRVNQEMEQLVRECPGQYLWGYARYKQPKGEAA